MLEMRYSTEMEETLLKSSYTVKTTSFEGPLELLLNLVESKKLFINEISLAGVTEEFLQATRKLGTSTGLSAGKPDLAELTSFLSIAATLILIKSRSLLPGFLVTKEEEQDIKDLESRLTLYALIRDISAEIAPLYGAHVIHLPPERELFTSVFAPDPKLTIGALQFAAREVLNRVPKVEVLPQVKIRKVISIDEMLTSLTERISEHTRISFRDWQKTVVGKEAETIKTM